MPKPRIIHLLSQAQHALLRHADRHLLDRVGVTSTQLAALLYVEERHGCSLKELGRGLGLNAPAAGALAERLERLGFATRRTSDMDARSTRIDLAPEGRNVLARARPLVTEFNDRILDGMSPDDIRIVTRFLDGIRTRFSGGNDPSAPPPSNSRAEVEHG